MEKLLIRNTISTYSNIGQLSLNDESLCLDKQDLIDLEILNN